MSGYEYGDPAVEVPHCPADEANRLRDLWRPEVQVGFIPSSTSDLLEGDERELTALPKDYDPTQVSLTEYRPMYVIPPAIADPLQVELEEHEAGPFFEQNDVNWNYARMKGVTRFLEGYLGGHAWRLPRSRSKNLELGFDPEHRDDERSAMRTPWVAISAPYLEKQIPSRHTEVTYFGNSAVGADAERRHEAVYDSGRLGWTIPKARKDGEETSSLLRLGNHLITARWGHRLDGHASEKLVLSFKYPLLTAVGRTMLDAALVELEPLVPKGTDYNELYSYHRIASFGRYPDIDGKWLFTEADLDRMHRDARQNELARRRRHFHPTTY